MLKNSIKGRRNKECQCQSGNRKVSFDYDPELVDLKDVAARIEDAGYKLDITETTNEEISETELKTSNSDYQQG